ncbi:uncharacterized protein LOC105216039 isoform X2 [Zeugodacus cucurbitae]|uniref:uncharacterized protein LOC105216039 isoform X2 n=1 Tax=Zeugodacus cucurbitae TaxID=28588 RepID=UPI0005969ABB|nr:uncharacterized protein LOC105216039 isoform X2 [Zeugodacus cucurbitae]
MFEFTDVTMSNEFESTTPTNDLLNNTTTPQSQSDFHCCNWFGLYHYLVVLFVLLVGLCILFGKMVIKARRRAYRRLQPARLRAQGSGNACTPPANGNCTDNVAPRCDNPPTYETAMANYIDAKQQLRQMEEGAVAGAMAMSASTTTIETCISDVGQSRTDLRPNTTEDVTATGSVVFNTTNETTKPPL